MGLDTSIFQNLLRPPPTVQDYDAQNQQYQTNSLNIQKQRQDQSDANALRQATMQFGSDQSANLQGLQKAGLAGPAAAYQKAIFENQKTQSETGKNIAATGEQSSLANLHQVQTQVQAHDFAVQKLGAVDPTDPTQVAAWLADSNHAGVSGFETQNLQGGFQKYLGALQQGPQAVAAWKQQALQGGMSATDQLKQQQQALIAQQQQAGETARNAATNATHVQTTGITQAHEDSRAAAGRKQQLMISGMNPDGSAITAPNGQVEPWIANAATRFNLTGELPKNLGRGAQGSGDMRRIQQEAARQGAASGMTPEQMAQQQVTGKKTLASFAPGGKDGASVESANIGLNHLDTLRQLAEAQANGNLPLFNQLANKLSAEFGGSAPTNLQGAVTMVGPEITKAVVGAGGGVADREKTDKALAALTKGSPAQASGQIHTMQDLLGGRLLEKKRSYERGSGLKDFDTAGFLSPAAQRVLAARGGGSPASAAPQANAQGWVLHRDASGNQAYVSPDGKQFEAVSK